MFDRVASRRLKIVSHFRFLPLLLSTRKTLSPLKRLSTPSPPIPLLTSPLPPSPLINSPVSSSSLMPLSQLPNYTLLTSTLLPSPLPISKIPYHSLPHHFFSYRRLPHSFGLLSLLHPFFLHHLKSLLFFFTTPYLSTTFCTTCCLSSFSLSLPTSPLFSLALLAPTLLFYHCAASRTTCLLSTASEWEDCV